MKIHLFAVARMHQLHQTPGTGLVIDFQSLIMYDINDMSLMAGIYSLFSYIKM